MPCHRHLCGWQDRFLPSWHRCVACAVPNWAASCCPGWRHSKGALCPHLLFHARPRAPRLRLVHGLECGVRRASLCSCMACRPCWD
ncbi:hypothetical protein V6N13_124778 [Hibiscus sabdariffa]|uniref:Uncharacterized protein n=1 Tax=Hibiscus sabdariffa TaxID=183260 RepID=A0ABR2U4I2_9ROSI